MFVDSNSFHIQIQITEKILTTEQEGQKYTNYSKVMIKESLLGTRRYLSRGGGEGGERILGALYGYQEERGDQGEDRGGGGAIENWLPKREDHY